mmetsp:Transcript_30004/g.41819  ORF Transcript_30004/g.41819 Transcript_30004/m.41819 type:complete len:134 (+) Transcript_30004:571-972(+)
MCAVFNLRSLLKHDDSTQRPQVNRGIGQGNKSDSKNFRKRGATPQSGLSHKSNTDKGSVGTSQNARDNLISSAENKSIEQGSILEVKTSAGFSIELHSMDVRKIHEASGDSAAAILQIGSTGAVRHLYHVFPY